METIKETELNPKNECPKCGEQIVTWWTDRLKNPDESIPDDKCWFEIDQLEAEGPTHGFSGNVVVIDHHGPQL